MDPLLLELPAQLEAKRLFLRKYREGDGPALLALLERNDNRIFLQPNVEEVASIRSVDEAEIKVRRHAAEWIARKRFVMGVWVKKDNLYIGEIWIEPNKWVVPSFELGWFLDNGYQGKGLATEAARCAMIFIFDHLKAHKVIVITRDTNDRSMRLAERLGFQKEGHFREARIEGVVRYGLIYYGMLKTEFVR